MRIVIPGGSGHLGKVLARHFHEQGHIVVVLSRSAQTAKQDQWRTVPWDGRTLGTWAQEIDGADVVINLAGRSVNCRYTQANRREIKESRVLSTRVIGEAIAQAKNPPALWINSSTATIYRHALDRPMDEATGELGGNEPGAPSTWNFSIDVAKSWEAEFFAVATPHTRKIALRSTIVMSAVAGSPFDILLRLVRFGLGGQAGSGKQYVSWIHQQDFVRAIEFLIAHKEMEGCVNVASPNPLPNADFMGELRHAYGRRTGLPATRWMLEIGAFFLRTETELILKSRWVVPGRLLQAEFEFRFTFWFDAAQDIIAGTHTTSSMDL